MVIGHIDLPVKVSEIPIPLGYWTTAVTYGVFKVLEHFHVQDLFWSFDTTMPSLPIKKSGFPRSKYSSIFHLPWAC